MFIRPGDCCLLLQHTFPAGSLIRIWAREHKEIFPLGLDGTSVFQIAYWGRDCVHVFLVESSNNLWYPLNEAIIRCEDIVAMAAAIAVEETEITISLRLGVGEFGLSTNWEASLYTRPIPGEETHGRFTEWKPAIDNLVRFNMSNESEVDVFWGESIYVRLRTTEGYPNFDMVTKPFALNEGQEVFVPVTVSSAPFYIVGPELEQTDLIISLYMGAGDFGGTNNWETSLYMGAIPGEETNGRFTEWQQPVNNDVRFSLSNESREKTEAPWGEEIYVRLRTTEGYPTFDFVTQPFILLEGLIILVPIDILSASIIIA